MAVLPHDKEPDRSHSGPIQPFPNRRQRVLHDLLHDKNPFLADLYRGARKVLQDNENPDRIAQSACSLVELIDNMPKHWPGLEIEDEEKYYEVIQQRERLVRIALDNAKKTETYNHKWNGPIPKEVIDLLNIIDRQFGNPSEKKHRSLADVFEDFAEAIAPYSESIPQGQRTMLDNKRKQGGRKLRRRLQNIKHHDERPSKDQYNDLIIKIEKFLLEEILFLPYPQDATDLDILDEIIAKGEIDD